MDAGELILYIILVLPVAILKADNYSLKRIFQVAWVRASLGLKSESNRTYLGYAWWVLEPAVHLAVFYVVFELLLLRGGPGYVYFLMVGIIHWLWFAKSVMNSSQSIMSGRGIILQIGLPKIVFPLAVIMQDMVKQSLVLVLLLTFLSVFAVTPTLYWLAYPLILSVQLILVFAVATLVASLVPFIPDLRVIVPAGLQFAMFLSGIFFTRDTIPVEYHRFLNLNPMFVLIESYRDIFLRAKLPDLSLLGTTAAVLVVLAAASVLFIKRMENRYARLV